MNEHPKHSSIGRIVREVLDTLEGGLDLDGIGRFERADDGTLKFRPTPNARVFLSYVQEDSPIVTELYRELANAGLHPWMDRHELLPGQNWRRAIERAIRLSDFYIPCFSKASITKRGTFHRELRYALRCSEEFPLDDTFVVPVRLDDCIVPRRIAAEFQYVDLLQDWSLGIKRLVSAIRTQMAARHGTHLLRD